MKIQIDLKSAVGGLAVGIAAMFVIGADSSPNQIGRYRISNSSSGSGDFITLVDTKTGEIWAHAGGIEGMGTAKLQNFWLAK